MKIFLSKIFLFFSYLVHISPMFIQKFLWWWLGFLWFDLLRIRRKVAIDNVERAFPNLDKKECVRIARASLRNMGRTIVEFNHILFYDNSQFDKYFEFENEHLLKKYIEMNKGVMTLSLHLGNGDFGITAMSGRGYSMNLISKRFKAKWLDEIWFGARGKHGTRFIAPRKSSFDILKALKRNEFVAFVLDQFMGPPLGLRTQFFGHETGTAFGLALFAQRTGAPVVPCYTYRRDDGKTIICTEEAIVFEQKDDKNQTLQYMTQKYTDKIEEIIRKYPEQWMWIHRRWKPFND